MLRMWRLWDACITLKHEEDIYKASSRMLLVGKTIKRGNVFEWHHAGSFVISVTHSRPWEKKTHCHHTCTCLSYIVCVDVRIAFSTLSILAFSKGWVKKSLKWTPRSLDMIKSGAMDTPVELKRIRVFIKDKVHEYVQSYILLLIKHKEFRGTKTHFNPWYW